MSKITKQDLITRLAICEAKLDRIIDMLSEQTQVTNTIHIDYDWREHCLIKTRRNNGRTILEHHLV